MTTTVRLHESVRDKLQDFKNDHGMTYNGAILRLLELSDMAPQEEKTETEQDPTETEHSQSSLVADDDSGYVPLPEPQGFYREGADGASDFVIRIIRSLMAGTAEYGPSASYAVWSLYAEMGIEPRMRNRTSEITPPTLDDFIGRLEDMIDNPIENTLTEREWEAERVSEQAKRMLRAMVTYQKIMGVSEIPLESETAPDLIVPPSRTYRGKTEDKADIVTAEGETLDPRPDLNSGYTDYSWGYKGTGPSTLATALLADAYPDRYARARGGELKDNLTTKLPMGESWEIQADELQQYLSK
jgi:hypothetical protein